MVVGRCRGAEGLRTRALQAVRQAGGEAVQQVIKQRLGEDGT